MDYPHDIIQRYITVICQLRRERDEARAEVARLKATLEDIRRNPYNGMRVHGLVKEALGPMD